MTIDNSTKSVVFAPAETISQQVDFITGNASGDKAQNEGNGVELTFDHRLAQIEVQAKNTNSAYVFKVKGVKIGKPVSSGTFDLGTQKWTSIGNNKINYTIRYEQEVQLDATAKNIMDQHGSTVNGNAMLIPQELTAWDPDTDGNNNSQNAYLSVLVNIKTKDGAQVYPATQDEYGWAAVGIGTKWESGKKYVYTLDFSNGAGNIDPEEPENPGGDIFGEGITFEVSVNPWQPANPYPGDNEI